MKIEDLSKLIFAKRRTMILRSRAIASTGFMSPQEIIIEGNKNLHIYLTALHTFKKKETGRYHAKKKISTSLSPHAHPLTDEENKQHKKTIVPQCNGNKTTALSIPGADYHWPYMTMNHYCPTLTLHPRYQTNQALNLHLLTKLL